MMKKAPVMRGRRERRAMANSEREKKKSLKDRAQELVQGVSEALESLFPQPQLLPIPVSGNSRPIRRPRR
jgi:hypothetical protein